MRSPAQTNKEFYVVGGTLKPGSPSYVERQADQELYERTLTGDFCYVLTPRQMGKSSLMARTARRLREEGLRTAIVDLTQIGSEQKSDSADRWYYGIAHRIIREIGVEVNLSEWWKARENLPALQRLTEFFSDVVLAKTSERVVIFVDEIDTTISLPFTDDFFAAIRACHNARATEPEFERLSFVLLGAASPSDLIKDVRRTPFNIGHRIDLTDFTFEEARPLADGLKANGEECETALQRILYWTGGHPYLTQKLCQAVTQEKSESCDDAEIDRLVEDRFLKPEANREDSNLNFVRDRLVQNKRLSRRLLKLYLRIYRGEKVIDSPLSPVHSALKLSSVVAPSKDRELRVRNRIYERVLTDEWARKAMPADWNGRIAIASTVVLLLGIGVWYTALQPLQYIIALRTASDDYPLAAYTKLRRIPGYADKADELLAEFWDRRALREEAKQNREEALLSWLKALSVQATDNRRRQISMLAGEDYKNRLLTFRHGGQIDGVAFSPDGKTLLTGSSVGTARLWSIDTGQPIGQSFRDGSPIRAVAFSPDGKTVLTGSSTGTAQLWSVDTGQSVGRPFENERQVWAVAFSPDGKTVLTGSDDATARLWSVDTGQPVGQPFRHGGSIRAVAFSPDGKTVLTGSDDTTARLWSLDTGQPVGQPFKHEDRVLAVAFSPDGKTVLTGSNVGTVRLWSLDTGQPIQTFRHGSSTQAIAFSPDSKTVLTGNYDGTARLWNVDTGQPIGQPFRHVSSIRAVAFSPDGKTVLTGSSIGTARLWSIDTSQSTGQTFRHERLVQVAAFSPDGKTLLTGSDDTTARLWSVDTGQPVGQPLGHEGSAQAVAFSPDGKTVLTGTSEGTVRLWSLDTGQPLGQLLGHESSILIVAFSPDGKIVLTGNYDGTVRLWSVDTGEPIQTFGQGSSTQAVAFSPDSKTVLTGNYDGTARLWSVDTGQPIGQPFSHEDPVIAVAFSPDGKTVLTGSGVGIARLWSVDTGQPIGQPLEYQKFLQEGERGSVQAVAFSPDGKTVVLLTLYWAHQLDVSDGNFETKANHWFSNYQTGAYRFLDDSGNRLQVVSHVTGNSLTIETMQFDSLDASPLPGDPNSLLDEWQRKLDLKFDDQGKIVPMWPVESRNEPDGAR